MSKDDPKVSKDSPKPPVPDPKNPGGPVGNSGKERKGIVWSKTVTEDGYSELIPARKDQVDKD